MSAVLIGIEVGCQVRELGPERRARNEAPAALGSRLRPQFLFNLAQPELKLDPEQSQNPLGPSQGASQLNQTTQRLYVKRPVILTSKGCAAAHSAQQK
ncbi:hypothetical protein PGTUg99_030458 [Puccinia graminis f. sp. tritici]|uniref:Uncharacterized protein n=1 Tax=Puccinia graminis f. sp. tritici TaxID=56615 RepID=A0A5B0NG23_PUCGR|nr:hypothetical protein PGTUg99_030458 [Puccinia graminis f. sp. tritici]